VQIYKENASSFTNKLFRVMVHESGRKINFDWLRRKKNILEEFVLNLEMLAAF